MSLLFAWSPHTLPKRDPLKTRSVIYSYEHNYCEGHDRLILKGSVHADGVQARLFFEVYFCPTDW